MGLGSEERQEIILLAKAAMGPYLKEDDNLELFEMGTIIGWRRKNVMVRFQTSSYQLINYKQLSKNLDDMLLMKSNST